MIIDLNWIVALVGCAALPLLWLCNPKSGARGLTYVLTGWVLIIAAVLIAEKPARLVNSTGAFLVVALLVALFVLIVLVLRTRRHIPRYQAPEELAGRCSHCGYKSNLTQTARGWLCVKCQTKMMLAGKL